MSILQTLQKRARNKHATIVLPESRDERVIKAANFLQKQGIAQVILLDNKDVVRSEVEKGIRWINPDESPMIETYASFYFEQRKHKGISLNEAEKAVSNPLYFAAIMVAMDDADGCVAGSLATTGEVLRAAIQCIGLKKGSSVVSSTFLMTLTNNRVLTYADCGVVPYPDAEQLAGIALDSAETHHKLTGEDPVIAFLSFSTKGSAKHESVELITQALKIAKDKRPDLPIDGEFQFDAAFVPEIAKRKAPNSVVAGKANVFIFPNLDAGNIAYKITERIGGAVATGPLIQGLSKPMMDLSRGCSWEDIVHTANVCSLM